MFSLKEKKAILKRLHYLQGQLAGIERMVEGGRGAQEVFDQLKAVERGVHTTIHDVLENQLKMRLAEILSERLAACPGNCSDAERLQYTKKQFVQFDLKGVLESLSWLSPENGKARSVK